MVESLRRIAQKFELPKGFSTNIKIGGSNSSAGLSGAPGLLNSPAGDELIAFFAARCVDMREKRQKLAERAETVEKQFSEEVRSVNSLAGEWRVFQKSVSSLGSVNDELKRVRERVQALTKACEDIEMACTICSENLEREKAEKEAVKRTQALDDHRAAAKRKNERLERSLDEKAQHAEKDSQGLAMKRVEEYKRKVEEAFDRATKKDFSDWISGKTPRKGSSATNPPANAETTDAKDTEAKPLPLEKEQEKFEKMLEGVEPVKEEGSVTQEGSEDKKEEAESKEEEEKKEEKEKDGAAKGEGGDDKKARKQKAPKVLGDVDVL